MMSSDLPGLLTVSVQNRGTFNPDDPNICKAIPWAAGGTAAALSPGGGRRATGTCLLKARSDLCGQGRADGESVLSAAGHLWPAAAGRAARRVASIPVAVVDIAAAQGLDILGDPEAMRKFLNDPDNRAFRTTLERV